MDFDEGVRNARRRGVSPAHEEGGERRMSPTLQQIRERLAGLEPERLDIVDDSAKHAGHAGARGGAGHFDVTVVSSRFVGLNSVARHRLVYGLLADLIPQQIHAIAIRALTPGSAPSAGGSNDSQP